MIWCNRTAKVVKIKKLSTIGQEFFCYFYLLSFRLTLPHAGASLQLVPNSKFSSHCSHNRPCGSHSHHSHQSHNRQCGSHPIAIICPLLSHKKNAICSYGFFSCLIDSTILAESYHLYFIY